MTERIHFHFSLSCIGKGKGNPLQCSCLENPRDGGAWWAAVYGVAQSWTRLKRLSSILYLNEKNYDIILAWNQVFASLSLVSNCPIIRFIPDPPTSSFLPSIMESRHSAVKLLSLGRRRRWSRESAVLSRSVLSDSLWPHGLQPGSSVHGDSPGKYTGVGCHTLLQGIFPTQVSNPDLLPCRRIL